MCYKLTEFLEGEMKMNGRFFPLTLFKLFKSKVRTSSSKVNVFKP